MMIRCQSISFVWFLSLFTAGCGAPATNETASLKHTLDEPTRGSHGFMWKAASTSEYDTHLAPLLGLQPNSFLAFDHDLVQRTQAWLDAMDGRLREDQPQDLANVPKPQARVVLDPTQNAFVAPIPVCFDSKVTWGGTGHGTRKAVFLDLATGELSDWPIDDLPCMPGGDSNDLRAMIDTLNSELSSCAYTLTNDQMKTLTPGSNCLLNEDLLGATEASRVVVFQMANFVNVHTGLFNTMSEEAFVAVLAHELGHYYRAHGLASETLYDYFYRLDDTNSTVKPLADEALRADGERAVEASAILDSSDAHVDVPSQALASELYFVVVSIIDNVGAAANGPAVCKQARTFVQSRSFSTAMSRFPFVALTDEMRSAYRDFEARALACLALLTFDDTPTLTPASVGWGAVLTLARTPSFPSWAARSSQFVASQHSLTSERLGQTAPQAASAKEALLAASMRLTQQVATSVAILQSAQAARLGQYTAEQEADDLSAEWIADIGLDPQFAVDAMRSLGTDDETSLGGMLLGATDCDALFAAGWRNAQGDQITVPIGNYSEVHHSACFRMFNLTREIAAHDLRASDRPVARPQGESWDNLQHEAARLSANATSGAQLFGPEKIRRATERALSARTCVYAKP